MLCKQVGPLGQRNKPTRQEITLDGIHINIKSYW